MAENSKKKPDGSARVVSDPSLLLRQLTASKLCAVAFDRYVSSSVNRNRTILSIALAASLFVNIYHVIKPTTRDYIYTDARGRIIVLYAMDQPNMSDNDVASWASDAVTGALSFDYVNWRGEFEKASHDFTKPGWDSFQKNLESSQLLQYITDNDGVLTTRPTASPQVIDTGLVGGAYAWRLKIPLQLTTRFRGQNGQAHSDVKNLIANITIIRQPEVSSEKGIAIAKIMLLRE